MEAREAINADMGPETFLKIGAPSCVTTKDQALRQATRRRTLRCTGSMTQRTKELSNLLKSSTTGSTLKANLMPVAAQRLVALTPDAAATWVGR